MQQLNEQQLKSICGILADTNRGLTKTELKSTFHYVEDSQLLNTLRFSQEMRDYCGFEKVPDAAKLTRFKQDFCEYIRDVFELLVDMTEPICA